MSTKSSTENGDGGDSARPASKSATLAKWLRTSIASLLVLAVLAVAGVAVVALIRGTWSVNPVVSGSMRPGFAVGGVVISERVPVNQLMVRDVILFNRPDKPSEQMVHRIVQISKSSTGQILIKTQGDANNVRDPWTLTIRGSDVYRVRWSLPLIGYVAVAYQNNRGPVLLGVGLLIIGVALATAIRERRHKSKLTADEVTAENVD